MRKYININFDICDPAICNPGKGICSAVEKCTRNLLEQEEVGGVPVLLSTRMCVGCARCIEFCPLNAISVMRGY